MSDYITAETKVVKNKDAKHIKAKIIETPKPKVLIACPNGSGMRNEWTVNGMFSLGWVLGASGVMAVSRTYDNHPLSLARNAAVRELLESKEPEQPSFTHIFFVDSDIVPPVDIITRFLKYDLPIVSGWYLSRKGTGVPVVSKIVGSMTPEAFANLRYKPETFPKVEQVMLSQLLTMPKGKDGLIQVDVAGAGCMLVKREVFEQNEKLPHLSKPYFYEDPLTEHGFSEDVYFSLNCKIHGIPIKIDVNALCPHYTTGLIDGRHVQALIRKEMMENARKNQNPASGPM